MDLRYLNLLKLFSINTALPVLWETLNSCEDILFEPMKPNPLNSASSPATNVDSTLRVFLSGYNVDLWVTANDSVTAFQVSSLRRTNAQPSTCFDNRIVLYNRISVRCV